MMGLEPTTFCMAIGLVERVRSEFLPASPALLIRSNWRRVPVEYDRLRTILRTSSERGADRSRGTLVTLRPTPSLRSAERSAEAGETRRAPVVAPLDRSPWSGFSINGAIAGLEPSTRGARRPPPGWSGQARRPRRRAVRARLRSNALRFGGVAVRTQRSLRPVCRGKGSATRAHPRPHLTRPASARAGRQSPQPRSMLLTPPGTSERPGSRETAAPHSDACSRDPRWRSHAAARARLLRTQEELDGTACPDRARGGARRALIADAEYRGAFLHDPAETLRRQGLERLARAGGAGVQGLETRAAPTRG